MARLTLFFFIYCFLGLRIAVGSQDIQRVPPYVELFGRTINLACSRARWFDLPLTRDESLQADKKVTLTFGVSGDPTFVTILDSVKVYGRTKESFGWPEDNEEVKKITSFFICKAKLYETSKQEII